MKVLALAPMLAAAALLASGCGAGGSGKSDKQQIEDTVTAYYAAFGKGDTVAACRLFTTETAKGLERAGGGKPCAKVLDQARQRPDYARIAAKLDGVQVKDVKIAADMASARTEVPGVKGPGGRPVSTTIPLKKESGRWKIASSVGEKKQ